MNRLGSTRRSAGAEDKSGYTLDAGAAASLPQPMTDSEVAISRRVALQGGALFLGAATMSTALDAVGGRLKDTSGDESPLERQKAAFERMSSAELAQWILDSSGDTATNDKPVRTPETTPAYHDLKNIAEGQPAYSQTLLKIDGKAIKMSVEINRDILLFRALLTSALQDPAYHFDGKPILVQSGQLTNRSGSHKGSQEKSHFYGSSIDCSGAIIDGDKSDDPSNLHPYDSPINQQLGRIIDEIGALVGVTTSGSPTSLERADSLHGAPGLSKGHYHLNVSSKSASKHATTARESIKGRWTFETDDSTIDLQSATISREGRDFIHTYETFRGQTYGDAHPGGTLTIGYGATYYLEGTVITRGGQVVEIEGSNQKPQLGDTITQEEADRLSGRMIEQEYLRPVVTALEQRGMPTTQSQLDALVSYSFHRGGGNATKLVARLHKLSQAGYGNDELAIKAAFMYDINGPVEAQFRNGVANRYLDTADIFTSGDYHRQYRSFDPLGWDAVIKTYFQ